MAHLWIFKMSIKRFVSMVAAAAVLLLTANAATGDFSKALRFKSPAVCQTEGGSTVNLDPGRYLPEPTWVEIDTGWKKMENRITHLEAENKALDSTDPAVLISAVVALIGGILIDRYALDR